MRIVIICGAGMVSGKEIMTLALLQGLQQRGHACTCLTSFWGSPVFRARLQEIGIPFWILRIGFISRTLQWKAIRMTLHQLLYLPGLFFRYAALMRKVKPDLVIHTNFHHAFLLIPVLSSRNYYWSHEIIPFSRFYKRLFTLLRRHFELFVGVSQAVGASLARIVGDQVVVVVCNGLVMPTKNSENGSANGSVIAIIGQISAEKGHEVLLEAISQARLQVPDIRLRIVGAGDAAYIKSLKKRIKSFGMEEKVEWAGFLSDKADIYRGVDIVVVPSKFPDPYPTVIIESGFFGTPVIASNIGGIPEMVSEGVNGFLFATGDAAALSDRIAEVFQRKNLPLLRETSRKFALTNFAFERFIEEFENLVRRS
jgi:glycosyltransferase involved in cell wall biosynthesis